MRFFVIILLSIIIFSCSDQMPAATITVPQKKTVLDTFPFVSEDKVDTSKMMVIDERCVVEAFFIDSFMSKSLRSDQSIFLAKPQSNAFYHLIDANSFYHVEIKPELIKMKIPILKWDEGINYLCFIDQKKNRFFVSTKSLRQFSGAIYFNGKQKPFYDTYEHVLGWPKEVISYLME